MLIIEQPIIKTRMFNNNISLERWRNIEIAQIELQNREEQKTIFLVSKR